MGNDAGMELKEVIPVDLSMLTLVYVGIPTLYSDTVIIFSCTEICQDETDILASNAHPDESDGQTTKGTASRRRKNPEVSMQF